MNEGRFQKGRAKTGGRKKGSPNRMTSTVKEAIELAFNELGGVDFLVSLGKRDPRAFASLLVKTIPLQMQSQSQVDIVEAIYAGRRRAGRMKD